MWISGCEFIKKFFFSLIDTFNSKFWFQNNSYKCVFVFRSWDEIVDPSDIVLKYKPENNGLLMSVALLNDYIFKDDLPKYCISLTKFKILKNFSL